MKVTRHTAKQWINNSAVEILLKKETGNVAVHWHEFYEIELILSGSGVCSIDGIPYSIQRGFLYCLSTISFHELHFDGEVELINIMFPPNFANTNYLSKILKSGPHVCTMLCEEDICFITTLAKEANACNNDPNGMDYLEAILNCILAKITMISSGESRSIPISPINRSILYIQDNLSNELTLETVSAVANYSPNYFSEIFKKETGNTFNAYVRNMRLSFAKKLLLYSDLTVTEICYECGFRDYSNFMRSFKNTVGTSPNIFRKEHSTE